MCGVPEKGESMRVKINYGGDLTNVQNKWAGFETGNWVVLDAPVKRGRGGHFHVLCLCRCGEVRYVSTYSLSQGVSNSCGCLTNKGAKPRAEKY